MEAQSAGKTVLVLGDVTMDWNLAHFRCGSGTDREWTAVDSTRACPQPGGAALLKNLIEALASKTQPGGSGNVSVRGAAFDNSPLAPGDERYHHSYAMWEPVPSGDRSASATKQV